MRLEVYPIVLRPYLTGYVNMCWVLCHCVAAATQPRGGIPQDFICRTVGVASTHLDWWSVRSRVFMVVCSQSGREGAQKTLLRLTSPSDPTFNPDETIAKIEHINELEKAMSAATTYWDCFKWTDLRRTEIVCGVWLIQTICAMSLMGYSSYFFVQAGLPAVQSLNIRPDGHGLGRCYGFLVSHVV
ncbi:hypothetical protein POJ06DRAFT_74408 [Lipomyces tetrasporus]|uniref:Uncharacterized protein n=1 Tax=Lipomyces tetrasporus TaxID=54092 RepID=A0AAD7QV99_9ASCO|nr:uncharacterized protein POJ06DRAFT_74408 [Lipomyces tetrasporus]KAJ8101958.1 hypothetical protein POJ06DRAFT_74408 [Lipomyces tetrasporus]